MRGVVFIVKKRRQSLKGGDLEYMLERRTRLSLLALLCFFLHQMQDIYTVLLNSIDTAQRDQGERDLEKRGPNEMKIAVKEETWINVHLSLSLSFSV